MQPLIEKLKENLITAGFCPVDVESGKIPNVLFLLKRQTWNTNRAVVFISLPQVPEDFKKFVNHLRSQVAWRCKFFPFFYGIGIQVIIAAPHLLQNGINPQKHVALVDNQWAIVQSLFLIDTHAQSFVMAKSWGQFVTGKFQDLISDTLSMFYKSV